MKDYWKLKTQLPNAKNQEVVNEYLLNLKVENKSYHTINNVRYFFQMFFKDEQEPFDKLTSNHIQDWFIEHDTGRTKNTIRYHVASLTSFYRFCVEEEYIKTSPIKKRWFPRASKPVPKYLDRAETAIIRQQIESIPLRNRVIVEFLLTSGCRVGELHELDRNDVDLEERTARVTGKGRKSRQIHFTEKTALLLEQYLQSRKDDLPALIVSSKKNPTRLSIGMIRMILNDIGKKAELSSSLHPHRLRHTFATDLLAKGADLLFIADELGHSDIQTTQIYARLPKQQIISLYRKYMG